MKNINTVINVVLGIAVAVLFYFQFSGAKPAVVAGSKSVAAGDFRIAYFEIDSVESQFNYYKEVSNSIQAKAQKNNNELNQLKELLDVCKQVEADHSLAESLLPSESGFFFGATDYDEWYYNDIANTIKILEDALVDGDDFYYSSSW